jgi:hypothetical protein
MPTAIYKGVSETWKTQTDFLKKPLTEQPKKGNNPN